jgi:hypothetical protein
MAVRQQQRRGTASQWTAANPILSAAEIGYETDTNKFKIGDGTNRWAALNYFVDLNTTIAGAPGLLNSLDEIAAAIGDDPAFFTTVSTNLSNHQADTTNIHGIANTALLVTQDDLSTALTGATVDQSALAGVGIDWNSTTEAFDIDSTVATKTYVDAAQDAADLDATSKVQAESLARATAITAALVTAAEVATNKVATEESNRNTSIASAIANEVTNRNSAISTAKLVVQGLAEADATSKANAAQAAAEATAAADATTKANSAITTATATASADATTKADAAKAFATAADTTLRTAITTDIATAKSEAITAATNAVNAVVASAPAALDTLDELAAALGDDADYAATITNALAAKAPLASPALTGNPTAPTQTLGNDSTRVATTAFVKAAIQDISSLNLVLDGGGVE